MATKIKTTVFIEFPENGEISFTTYFPCKPSKGDTIYLDDETFVKLEYSTTDSEEWEKIVYGQEFKVIDVIVKNNSGINIYVSSL